MYEGSSSGVVMVLDVLGVLGVPGIDGGVAALDLDLDVDCGIGDVGHICLCLPYGAAPTKTTEHTGLGCGPAAALSAPRIGG